MKTREQAELENMALAAELARQLCHDCNNFIYNLFLQIEIGAASASAAKPNEWEGVKREGKKMVRLMQEWEHFNNRLSFDETMIDLHQVICQVAGDVLPDHCVILLAPAISAEPLFVAGSSIDSRHLMRLLLEDAASYLASGRRDGPCGVHSNGESRCQGERSHCRSGACRRASSGA